MIKAFVGGIWAFFSPVSIAAVIITFVIGLIFNNWSYFIGAIAIFVSFLIIAKFLKLDKL